VTTAKKAAPAKKAAASADTGATTEDTTTTPAEGDEPTADSGSTNAASTAVESGPQTGTPATDETTARPPATIVNESPAAAPLDPPADSHTQREPANGIPTSSTDQTYAEVGGQTIAGENHVQLVDREGNAVSPQDLFHQENARDTHVIATQRVYELFTYPNTTRTNKRLIYAEGARVPRAQAARIQAAATTDAEAAEGSTPE
jgi:hypothetical protein